MVRALVFWFIDLKIMIFSLDWLAWETWKTIILWIRVGYGPSNCLASYIDCLENQFSTTEENTTKAFSQIVPQKYHPGTSLMLQWLRFCTPMQGGGRFNPLSGYIDPTCHNWKILQLRPSIAKKNFFFKLYKNVIHVSISLLAPFSVHLGNFS